MEKRTVPIKLSQLLSNVTQLQHAGLEREVVGLTLDSREVKPGYVFFACRGHQNDDGNRYIDEAIRNKAAVVMTDSSEVAASRSGANDVPVIFIADLSRHVSTLAANFYDHPSRHMYVVGITGTNGKTSFCHFLGQALTLLGESVGVLGTLGNGIFSQQERSTLTTPDPIKLQALLAEMRLQGVRQVAMEVSSHGIEQGRVNAVDFDVAVFTNLSRDHLDYHGTMEAYGNAKRKLFQKEGLKHAIFNIDDVFGRQLLAEFYTKKAVFAYSAEGRLSEYPVPTVRAEHVHLNMKGVTASLRSFWGDGVLHAAMLGRFNLSNLLAVFSVLCISGVPIETIFRVLSQLQSVTGRMQVFGGGDRPHVIIDYAHTPDALKQVLLTLKDYAEGEVWCVFGCGGNRDQGKRAQMGQIAEMYADKVIVTDDNPRQEKPMSIVADILSKMIKPESVIVEHNRRRAIAHAIDCAKMGDIILVAGKGHENYQIYGDEHLPFSDEMTVRMLLASPSGEAYAAKKHNRKL